MQINEQTNNDSGIIFFMMEKFCFNLVRMCHKGAKALSNTKTLHASLCLVATSPSYPSPFGEGGQAIEFVFMYSNLAFHSHKIARLYYCRNGRFESPGLYFSTAPSPCGEGDGG